jgi:K+ transporter
MIITTMLFYVVARWVWRWKRITAVGLTLAFLAMSTWSIGWRQRLFTFLYRNEQTATAYYPIPPNRVVELGAQLELAEAGE